MLGKQALRTQHKPSTQLFGAKASPVLPVRRVAGQRSRQQPTVVASLTNRKELLESRFFRRTNADHEYWENYLTSDRYWKNILNFPSSRIYKALAGPLIAVGTTSTLVCIYETLRQQGALPEAFPSILLPNNSPLTLTSFAVSLLLVFRTNQSYDRWWEARKIWGTVLNRCRDIITQTCVFVPEDEKELRYAMRNWTIAFTRAMEVHLQGRLVQRDLKTNLQHVLNEKEMEMLTSSPHRVCKTLSVMSEINLQAPINSIERYMIQQNIQVFYDMLGMCERIMRTPLPLTYTRHSSRFLFFWINTLPFALYGSFGWGCIPITLVISLLLLGIDEIGVQIEEPFGVLPLDAICQRAETDMRSIVDEQPMLAQVTREMKPANAVPPPSPRSVPVEASALRGEREDLTDFLTKASRDSRGRPPVHTVSSNGAPSSSSNGTKPSDPSLNGADVEGDRAKQAMQAARTQVEKALQNNQNGDRMQHSVQAAKTAVGVVDAVQQQEQQTIADLRADLAKARGQLAELSQFLKTDTNSNNNNKPSPPPATQQVLGGQLAGQQEEITRLKAAMDGLKDELRASTAEVQQLRAELASSEDQLQSLQSMKAQMAAREMVMVSLENEVEDLQEQLHLVKMSLSKYMSVPLLGEK